MRPKSAPGSAAILVGAIMIGCGAPAPTTAPSPYPFASATTLPPSAAPTTAPPTAVHTASVAPSPSPTTAPTPATVPSPSATPEPPAATWTGPIALTTSGSPEGHGLATLSSSTAVALYMDTHEEEGARIYVRRSIDAGATWQAPQHVGNDGLYSAIAGSGTNVDILWWDGGFTTPGASMLRYRHSTDSGATFSAPVDLATGSYPDDGYVPNIARRGDVVAVIWNDGRTSSIRIRVSSDGGASFGPLTDLSTVSTSYAPWPVVAVGDGVVYAAYGVDDTHVDMRRSLDNGATWAPAVELAADAWAQSNLLALSLTASGGLAYLAYAAQSGASEWVRYRRTTDKGASWTDVADLSSPSGNKSYKPWINLSTGVVRVVYIECSNTSCSRSVVKYRESSDGTTWTPPETASLNTPTTWADPWGVGFAGRVIVLYTAQHGRDVYTCACDLYVSTK